MRRATIEHGDAQTMANSAIGSKPVAPLSNTMTLDGNTVYDADISEAWSAEVHVAVVGDQAYSVTSCER